MLKLGVVAREGLDRPRTILGKRRQISILLLEELARRADTTARDYDTIVEQMCMPNGVWKLTAKGRLSVLDATVVDLVAERFAAGSKLTVLDLAASTGVTSVEFYQALSEAYDVEMVASDLYREVFSVRSQSAGWAVVFDAEGHEVQYVWHGFVLSALGEESAVYPINRIVKGLCRKRFTEAARRALASVDLSAAAFEPITAGEFEVMKIPMLAKECLDLLRSEPRFRFETWNILDPLPMRAQVVRAMNILTGEHFDATRRATAIRNCVDATVTGGLTIFGWSPTADPRDVLVTVYEATGDGLRRLVSLNGGSEIDGFVRGAVRVEW